MLVLFPSLQLQYVTHPALALVCVGSCSLRILSFGLERCKHASQHQEKKSKLSFKLVNLVKYNLYFPVFVGGPFISYDQFAPQVRSSLQWTWEKIIISSETTNKMDGKSKALCRFVPCTILRTFVSLITYDVNIDRLKLSDVYHKQSFSFHCVLSGLYLRIKNYLVMLHSLFITNILWLFIHYASYVARWTQRFLCFKRPHSFKGGC